MLGTAELENKWYSSLDMTEQSWGSDITHKELFTLLTPVRKLDGDSIPRKSALAHSPEGSIPSCSSPRILSVCVLWHL